MRIATWNVNSLRVRLPQVLGWLAAEAPDVVALQETKVPDEGFPRSELEAAGYASVYCGQKTYNGVVILGRLPATDVVSELRGHDDPARRLIAATVAGVRVVNAYVPNGQAVGTEKYAYKLAWLERFAGYLRDELAAHLRLVVVGDFNVAPEPRDVHDPELWAGRILCSEPERAAFRALLEVGLADAFRLFDQKAGEFTWWDYRLVAFRRNLGLRIDHVLVSRALTASCISCRIDRGPRGRERPSDHTPVILEIETTGSVGV